MSEHRQFIEACKSGDYEKAMEALNKGAKIPGWVHAYNEKGWKKGEAVRINVFVSPTLLALKAYEKLKTRDAGRLLLHLIERDVFPFQKMALVWVNSTYTTQKGGFIKSEQQRCVIKVKDYLSACRLGVQSVPGSCYIAGYLTKNKSILNVMEKRLNEKNKEERKPSRVCRHIFKEQSAQLLHNKNQQKARQKGNL